MPIVKIHPREALKEFLGHFPTGVATGLRGRAVRYVMAYALGFPGDYAYETGLFPEDYATEGDGGPSVLTLSVSDTMLAEFKQEHLFAGRRNSTSVDCTDLPLAFKLEFYVDGARGSLLPPTGA